MTTQRRKEYIPLESNPGVFTKLIHQLGAEQQISVVDVVSLDEEMLEDVPRPVYALIFTLPTTDKYNEWRDEDEKSMPAYDGSGESEEVVWFKQTIYNACGFYGLLHSVSNGPAAQHTLPDTTLAKLLAKARPLAPDARAIALEEDREIESAYKEAAEQGDTEPPTLGEEVDYHYIAFVPNKSNDKIYLMDGVRKGPVDTGISLKPGEDVLLGAAKLIKEIVQNIDRDIGFNLMALVHSGGAC